MPINHVKILVSKNLELSNKRSLIASEVAEISQLSEDGLFALSSFEQRPNQTVLQVINDAKHHQMLSPIFPFASRFLTVWLIAYIGYFLSAGYVHPNIFHFSSRYRYVGDCLFALLLLWRYNDQNIQKHAKSYHRLSDSAQMEFGEVLEMCTRRYTFFVFFILFVCGKISEYRLAVNYFYLLDYLCFLGFALHTVPALTRDAWTAIFSEKYTLETSQLLEIPIEFYRSIEGFFRLQRRFWECVVVHRCDFSPVFQFRPKTIYQTWRYAELGVHAVGAVPRDVSQDYVRSSLLARGDAAQFRPPLSDWFLGLLNAADGRIFAALVNCYHAEHHDDRIYSYQRKCNTLQRGFSLLLEHKYLIPIGAKLILPNREFDSEQLIEFSASMIQLIQKDERLLKRSIQFIDLFCAFRSHDDFIANFVELSLRSDLYDGNGYLFQSRVDAYLSGTLSLNAQAMLIIRDTARFIAVGQESAENIHEILYFLGHACKAAAKVTWSDNHYSQSVIDQVFHQIGNYIAYPRDTEMGCKNFSYAVGRLAGLSYDECAHESPAFYWAVFDCLNFSCHAGGVVDTVCSDAFKRFLAGRMIHHMGSSQIEWMQEALGQHHYEKNRVELICHFLDTFMTTLEYDLLGCFQKSFENSVELNDFLKMGSTQGAVKAEISYLDTSACFLEGTLRFIDNVDHRPGLRANIKKDDRKQRAQDQSLIYCLGLIFQYFGSGRIYAADMLANLMYRNLLSNSSYVKWCLTLVEIFLSFFSLCRAVFYKRDRKELKKNLYSFSYGIYFLVTRSIFHVPRLCLFCAQLLFIGLGTILYNLGRERILVLCACFVAAIALVGSFSLPHLFIPIIGCGLFYAFQWVLHGVDQMFSVPADSVAAEVHNVTAHGVVLSPSISSSTPSYVASADIIQAQPILSGTTLSEASTIASSVSVSESYDDALMEGYFVFPRATRVST